MSDTVLTDLTFRLVEPSRAPGFYGRARARASAARTGRFRRRLQMLAASAERHAHTALLAGPGTTTTEVFVEFDPANGVDADAPSGRLRGLHRPPVGKPLRLTLDHGLQGLVVLVDDNGRFLASGPFY